MSEEPKNLQVNKISEILTTETGVFYNKITNFINDL